MNTDKVFIVNTAQGPRVVTPGVIEKDILNLYPADAPKVKAKDVTSYAQDLASELIGQAIDGPQYTRYMVKAVKALSEFAVLTPYNYGKMLDNQKSI